MRIAAQYDLINADGYLETAECQQGLNEIRDAIAGVVWPPGAKTFTVFKQSGKRRGEGNGVRPIRDAFVIELARRKWSPEAKFPVATPAGMASFGDMDASKRFAADLFMVEWETGNISSSHRAMNKLAIGLVEGAVSAGVLVLPTKNFAQYLTDRIGNTYELQPYFQLWSNVVVKRGYLGVIAVEQDDASVEVAPIRKGTDGRALAE